MPWPHKRSYSCETLLKTEWTRETVREPDVGEVVDQESTYSAFVHGTLPVGFCSSESGPHGLLGSSPNILNTYQLRFQLPAF